MSNEDKLKILKDSFMDTIPKKVAEMIATSHEYKVPNIKAGLHFTKNYDWKVGTLSIKDMQGINKPIIESKVNDIAQSIHKKGHISPFVVVNQLDAIRPQTSGKKMLIDGHHRLEACKKLGIDEVPVYIGKYTGNAHKHIDELKEKLASEEDFYYHASPVQDIKKFRFSEDTSGNNKGKVVFASKEPSFAVAFGTRWHDAIARLNVETKDAKVPKENNYEGTTLRYTDKVNIDSPCSMYKLKGKFKPLRYNGDLESYTNDNVEIASEEKFKSFKEMAKVYGLKTSKVSEGYVLSKLKGSKSSNFEKKASDIAKELRKNEYKDYIYKIASEKYYLKPIKCEVCNYEGKPTDDGYCPDCGALGGVRRVKDEDNFGENTTGVLYTDNIAADELADADNDNFFY